MTAPDIAPELPPDYRKYPLAGMIARARTFHAERARRTVRDFESRPVPECKLALIPP